VYNGEKIAIESICRNMFFMFLLANQCF